MEADGGGAMLNSEGDGAPSLRLTTAVDGAYLDHVECELRAVLHQRLSAAHARRAKALYPRWLGRRGAMGSDVAPRRMLGARPFVSALSALVLVGLLLLMGFDTSPPFGLTEGQAAFLLGSEIVLLWLAIWRFSAWFDRFTSQPPRNPLATPLASFHARLLLRQARRAAPFVAEYALSGARVVYARVAGDRRTPAWERTLGGWRHVGEHATLLFKTETAELPYCVVLIEVSEEFDACLDALGVKAFAPDGG